MNMISLRVTFYFFLSSFVAAVSGQTDCRQRFPDARSWIPASWRTILDSTDYDTLLEGSGSIWVRRDVDGDSNGFTQTGGVCTRSAYTCLFGTTADNWLFTQYLSFGSANEVFFNVSYDFRDCTFVDNCHPYVTLSRYDRISMGNAAQQINPSNYQYLTGSETTSQFGTITTGGGVQVTGIERPSSFTGFYLGIQDTGTCGTVRRVLVYYLVCPARVSGLVSFPQTPVPPRSSANTVYSGSCAPNSHAVTSLEVEITSTTSVCTERAAEGARCECDAGYSINGTSCEACPEGEYRASSEDQSSCNRCPSNSEARSAASTICVCESGFFRSTSAQESAATECTQPPGPVQNLVMISKTSTTVGIRWQRPSITGGRSDYYYSIEHSDPRGSASSTISVTNRLEDTAATITYTIENLLPFETYEISVITHNGVSDQVSDTISSRTISITIETSEGLPGPVSVTNLCSAVIWQAPVNPNGIISGYDVDILGAVMRLPSTQLFFVTSEIQREDNVFARVRAINGAGIGSWSQQSTICPDKCSLNVTLTTTSTSVGLRLLRPTSASGNVYTIELTSAGTMKSFNVSNGEDTISHSISGLNPFSTYTINITNGMARCIKTFATLEGVPSPPRDFKQYCKVVVWNTPSDVQGKLKNYELQFQSDDGQLETTYLEPNVSFYETTTSQKESGVKIRVRANNTKNEGIWTSFFSNGCSTSTTGSSSGILSSIDAIDVVIIVVITAALCIAICILVVVFIYVCYKCRSKSDMDYKKKSSNDVKMDNMY